MSKLSWPEIRQRAIQFSREWKGVTNERAEAQSFWNAFFNVFGLDRKLVATFEEPVKSLKNTHHRIDVFWKGTLLGEHKSAGESLDKAHAQAFNYVQELANAGRGHEIPRYIVLSDFVRLVLFDLQPDRDPMEQHPEPYDRHEFFVADLHQHVKHFAFLVGQQTVRFRTEDDANLDAARLMAELHDAIEAGGYSGHALERLLVRLLFCLFADDTRIFDINQFEAYIVNRTREDGDDLGIHLNALFEVLDTPVGERSKMLNEDLAAFPYINGDLFKERLSLVFMNRDMRNRLLAAMTFNWGRISPAVFGSLFQGIMDAKERRQIGAHYTSERDILKLIRPLFLDALREEFEQIKALKQKNVRDERLIAFQEKIASLRFLDPACGCGNFLVIAYRELRRLELELLLFRHRQGQHTEELPAGELLKLSKVDVHQFYGIEIEEWPARIAETALWLTDHQMNTELSLAFGNLFQRIPLKASPHIRCANALRMDWNDLLSAKECSFVLGNPPFIGKHLTNAEQKRDVLEIWGNWPGAGLLDYVTCWYKKAAAYTSGMGGIACAFVSTNSISQGEQPGYLWKYLFSQNVKIDFAYRTFAWESEAKGKAHVHVVIIGFSRRNGILKRIYYPARDESTTSSIQVVDVENINPYLAPGDDTVILPRTTPISDVPPTIYGNKPADGGFLIVEPEEYRNIQQNEPDLVALIRPMVSAEEFLNGKERYCFWLDGANILPYRTNTYFRSRLQKVRYFREQSTKKQTQDLASSPHLFAEIRQPTANYIVIPRHSSESREYIPFGYFSQSVIVHDSCTAIPNASSFHLGILTSKMHMAWVREVCGRLKSDYRYSAKLVYNNFPWPMTATEGQRAKVEECAQGVLDARAPHLAQGATLADLYDPLTMPAELLKAHQALDRAVDRCYRAAPFTSERERVEFLFRLYEELTAPLAAAAPTPKKRARRKA